MILNNDSRLDMEIGIDEDGKLLAVDNTSYEEWIIDYQDDSINHVAFERVLKWDVTSNEELSNIQYAQVVGWEITEATSAQKLKELRTFTLPSDGLYQYQKIVVPTREHRGESLCYADNDFLYLIDDPNTEHANRVDFDTAFEAVASVATGNAFWFDDYIVTIYNLIKCFVLTEKQRIVNWLKNNCRANCDVISTINSNADILMAAVNVLTYLISKRQWLEASRILNGLRTCNGLCKDFVNDIKGCGCGKSVY